MKTALLIIDIQNDYFPGGKNELVNSVEASLRAKELLLHFRKKNLPVIHIQHLSVRKGATFFIPGTTGADIHEHVRPMQEEKIITKNYPNSFRETSLLDHLKEKNIEHLVVSGMISHVCVDSTVRAAKDLGYQITVVADACATKDLTFDEEKVPAKDVQTSFMSALSYYYAEVKNTSALIKEI